MEQNKDKLNSSSKDELLNISSENQNYIWVGIYNELMINENFTKILEKCQDKSLPKESLCLINKYDDKVLFNYLKYKVLSDNNLSVYQTVDEGIDNKLKKEIINSNSIEELINRIKSKRYTYNKLNRMFIHILC